MSFRNCTAKVKSTARRHTDDPAINMIAGREVFFLPETGEWIDALQDHRFLVIPVNGKINSQDRITVCRQFLKPVGPQSEKIFRKLEPGKDYLPKKFVQVR